MPESLSRPGSILPWRPPLGKPGPDPVEAFEVPILSAVLTPQRFHDHHEHRAFFREHFKTKGAEVASACARTLETLAAFRC